MLQVYKKTEKNLENLWGAKSIQSLAEIDKPFLLCLSALDMYDKSVFGIIKEGARAARVRTSDEFAAGFKIDSFPVSFLGVKFKKDSCYKNNYEELTDSFIYPYLVMDGKKVDDIKRRTRYINFFTYCNGTLTYEKLEERLEEKFLQDGYSLDVVTDILSQISVVSIGTAVCSGDLKATTVTFIDVNDSEIRTRLSIGCKELLHQQNRKSIYDSLKKDNNILYVFEGSGNHSLKEYFLDNNLVKPAISGVLSYFLENSILNMSSDKLVTLSLDSILNQLKVYGEGKTDPLLLLEKLDDELRYANALKYTLEEVKIREELDISYKKLQRSRVVLTNEKQEKLFYNQIEETGLKK